MITDPPFSSLIVTFNSANEISQLLTDLQRLAPQNRVVVIDNASHDQTVEIIKTRFPEVSLIVNPSNVGYAKAVNQGFELCETEFVFLLNPDIRISNPRFHAALLECAQQSPQIAAVGPLQFREKGDRLLLNFTWSYWTPKGLIVFLSYLLHLRFTFETPIPTLFLNAGCLLLRRSAFLHVGKLNEKYFLYGEEPDLFLKLKRYRYECRLHPGAEVIHFRERSIGKLPLWQRGRIKLQALLNISDALVNGLVGLLPGRSS